MFSQDYKIISDHQSIEQNIFNLADNVKLPVLNLAEYNNFIPELDENYIFNPEVTEAIIAGILYNKKVFVHGLHGSGKSSHIEQVAARLKWPVYRINFDGFISRFELIGRDQIVIKDNKQVTEFHFGILPWVITKPFILILDEYDAAKPELLFVFQRLLEENGRLNIFETNQQITPHPDFRIFATSNTSGMGDSYGIYGGTNFVNQAQLDRWQLIVKLDSLDIKQEMIIITKKFTPLFSVISDKDIKSIELLVELLRNAFRQQELEVLFTTRSLINFCENILIFGNIKQAFNLTFTNKLEDTQRILAQELYQRCFG